MPLYAAVGGQPHLHREELRRGIRWHWVQRADRGRLCAGEVSHDQARLHVGPMSKAWCFPVRLSVYQRLLDRVRCPGQCVPRKGALRTLTVSYFSTLEDLYLRFQGCSETLLYLLRKGVDESGLGALPLCSWAENKAILKCTLKEKFPDMMVYKPVVPATKLAGAEQLRAGQLPPVGGDRPSGRSRGSSLYCGERGWLELSSGGNRTCQAGGIMFGVVRMFGVGVMCHVLPNQLSASRLCSRPDPRGQ